MDTQTQPIGVQTVASWDDTADVVIIGYGIAGACAALEARRGGADTLILERASGGGGTSIMSSGLFYLGGGTALQQNCGVTDTVEDMYQYLIASNGTSDPAMIRSFCENSVDHFDWLENEGIPFERSYYRDKHFCPPTTEGLLGTGSEKVWPYRTVAAPHARGHRVAREGDSAGSLAMEHLMARCDEAGIRTRYDTRVTALITEADSTVVGVRAVIDGRPVNIAARRGVILATGGFQHNSDLVRRYAEWAAENTEAIGIPTNDGAGILLGESVGAALRSMESMFITASFYPPSQLIKGILVNARGERFVAEDSYHGRTAGFVREQPGGIAYLIVDSETFAYPEFQDVFRIKLVDGWETVAEMESALNMPEGGLQKTLTVYNRDAEAGTDSLLHKHPDWLTPLDHAPFAAFDVSFSRTRHNLMTLGGLETTAEGAVVSSRGTVIPGLYAAGACASNIVQDAKGYASGMTLAAGSYFGRCAGRAAAKRPAYTTPDTSAQQDRKRDPSRVS